MLDLEEQEQLDALKTWWKRYGGTVVLAVAVAAAVVAGIQGWRYYQRTQVQQAQALYNALQNEVEAQDVEKIRAVAGRIMDKYAGTAYAPRAALLSAEANYRSGDAKSAKAQLQWVIDHAKEAGLQDAARLDLAAVYLDEKNYGEALKVLDAKHSDAYDALFSDRRGDVLAAQDNKAEARKSYQAALEKLDSNNAYRNYVQLKLDALGSAK